MNVSDKTGGDAKILADSHIICTSLNVSNKTGGDAKILADSHIICTSLNVSNKTGGDAKILADSHIISTYLNVSDKTGGDAKILADDFLEKHSGCLGAFGPSAAAAAFGRRRPPLRLDKMQKFTIFCFVHLDNLPIDKMTQMIYHWKALT